jgi:acyl-coenzyme A synthetase/AMP-(fatty) acid ligase
MIEGVDTTLVDPSFKEDFADTSGKSGDSVRVNISIDSWDSLINAVREAFVGDWRLGLYTSGSTGTPKHVWQSVGNLTRTVKTSPQCREHRWGFCYESTHMAGLQVFFQAISNGDPMVYLFESDPQTIGGMIKKHSLTHLSATPTFYRLRVSQVNRECHSVRRITSGGEPFDKSTMEKIKSIFPNADVRNIYALTETGALLQSNSEVFKIPESIDHLIKITEEKELLVHEDLVSDKKEDEIDEEGWFPTGDIVRKHKKNNIEFIGRKSDNVNIGGRKVNVRKIEKQVISSSDEVLEARVKARDSSVTGTILTTDIVLSSSKNKKKIKNDVRKKIENELPKYATPKKYNVVEKIETNRSGKKKR